MMQSTHQWCFETIVPLVNLAAPIDQSPGDFQESVVGLFNGLITDKMKKIFAMGHRHNIEMRTVIDQQTQQIEFSLDHYQMNETHRMNVVDIRRGTRLKKIPNDLLRSLVQGEREQINQSFQ